MDALTGIRGVAALWVVSYHYAISPLDALHLERWFPFVKFGYLGVDMFFILSGFIITHVHGRDNANAVRPVLHFYGLRLARMYPVHLVTLCALVPIVWGGRLLGFVPHYPEDFRAVDFLYNLLLIQSWGVSDDIHWNFPAWSISCEWFVYLLFPLAAIALQRISSWRNAVLWLAVETAGFAAAYVFYFRCDLDLRFNLGGFAHLALARVVFEFAAGALIYRVTELADLRSFPWAALTAAVMIAAFALASTSARDLAFVGLFGVAIAAGSYSDNLVARMLSVPVILYLGEISYSLYMVHAPIRMTLGKAAEALIARTGSGDTANMIGLGFLLATVLVAALVHRLVEAPARAWLRQNVLDPLIDSAEQPPASRPSPTSSDCPPRPPFPAVFLVLMAGWSFGHRPPCAEHRRAQEPVAGHHSPQMRSRCPKS